MLNWNKLFDRAKQIQEQRVEELELARENERRRKESENWMVATVPRIMRDIGYQAHARARQFLENTGVAVVVQEPHPETEINLAAPWLSYLTVSVGSGSVYLYATRGGGSKLYLHMISDGPYWAKKNQRMMSHPGCSVLPHGSDYALRYLQGELAGTPEETMQVDELVFRVFELLLTSVSEEAYAS